VDDIAVLPRAPPLVYVSRVVLKIVAASCMLIAGCEPRAKKLAPPPVPEAVPFVASSEVQSVAVGWNDLCLVMSDGSARCKQDWRPAGARRLGSFVTVTGALRIADIAAGHHHACARTDSGAVLCWGRNDSGEAGGDELIVRSARTIPLPAPAAEVRVGDTQSCARLTSNAVFCWGVVAGTVHAPPTPLNWFANATGISVSADALCAFNATGQLRCSFAGGKPLEPIGDGAVTAVALGRSRGCAVVSDKTVRCFSLGRPGSAPVTEKVPPWAELVTGLTDVVELVAGTAHFCARRGDGSVSCWGRNEYGQLGDGTRNDANMAAPVKRLVDAQQIAAGGDRTCAHRAKGSIVCWGADLLADAMFRALTGLAVDPGPPGPNDSLVPEELRIPLHAEPSTGATP
jgi:hypothetical protein